MVMLLVVFGVAVAVGWVAGGKLRNLAHVELNTPWLVFVAVGLQAGLNLVSASDRPTVWVSATLMGASLVATGVFLVRNPQLPGLWLIASGFALNALVIGVNGAMPVDPEAIRALSGDDVRIAQGTHRILSPDDRLPLLADIIPVAGLRAVISAGDIILAAGLGLLITALMRRFPSPPGRRRRPRPVPLWERNLTPQPVDRG